MHFTSHTEKVWISHVAIINTFVDAHVQRLAIIKINLILLTHVQCYARARSLMIPLSMFDDLLPINNQPGSWRKNKVI